MTLFDYKLMFDFLAKRQVKKTAGWSLFGSKPIDAYWIRITNNSTHYYTTFYTSRFVSKSGTVVNIATRMLGIRPGSTEYYQMPARTAEQAKQSYYLEAQRHVLEDGGKVDAILQMELVPDENEYYLYNENIQVSKALDAIVPPAEVGITNILTAPLAPVPAKPVAKPSQVSQPQQQPPPRPPRPPRPAVNANVQAALNSVGIQNVNRLSSIANVAIKAVNAVVPGVTIPAIPSVPSVPAAPPAPAAPSRPRPPPPRPPQAPPALLQALGVPEAPEAPQAPEFTVPSSAPSKPRPPSGPRPPSTPRPSPAAAAVAAPGNLLGQIRQGVQLKPPAPASRARAAPAGPLDQLRKNIREQVAPQEDDEDQDANDWNTGGAAVAFRNRVGGQFVLSMNDDYINDYPRKSKLSTKSKRSGKQTQSKHALCC
jgi:hypothetical protein